MDERSIKTRFIATPRSLRTVLKDKEVNRMKDVANEVGVKEATISRFDKQTRYDINTLVSLMKTYELTLEDLFIIEENELYENDGTLE
jgi:DNA-binding Xre family transcriptional regulator